MKRFLLLCLCVVVSITMYSQTQHLTFKGIPIDGNINSFVSKMQQKGFKKVDIETERNISVLEGKFAGTNCSVLVVATLKDLTVSKVVAYTEKYEGWHSLKSKFNDYIDLYSKKYGKPENVIERFRDPYYEGDGYELQALSKEKCVYFAFWNVDDGAIALQMTDDAEIKISYEDKVNFEKFVIEQENKQLDDI